MSEVALISATNGESNFEKREKVYSENRDVLVAEFRFRIVLFLLNANNPFNYPLEIPRRVQTRSAGHSLRMSDMLLTTSNT